jgi:hypothetical protein
MLIPVTADYAGRRRVVGEEQEVVAVAVVMMGVVGGPLLKTIVIAPVGDGVARMKPDTMITNVALALKDGKKFTTL